MFPILQIGDTKEICLQDILWSCIEMQIDAQKLLALRYNEMFMGIERRHNILDDIAALVLIYEMFYAQAESNFQ